MVAGGVSIEAMNWALQQRVGNPSGKAVLLILANRSDQNGVCWPGIDGIAEQTELSRRTVINQIGVLIEGGAMCVEHRGGDGEGRKSNVYYLHIAAKCSRCTLGLSATGAGQCATGAGLSAAAAPESSSNRQKNRQGEGARATRIPNDFELTPERRAVAEAEKVPAERTFETFCDYWRAEAGQKARKHDWDATWRNWCRRESSARGKANGSPRLVSMDQINRMARDHGLIRRQGENDDAYRDRVTARVGA